MVQRLIRTGANGLATLAGIFLILMMLQITVDAGMRLFFNAPIEGNLEVVSVYYMVGVVFLPLAMVEVRHEHISVELFVNMLKRRVQSYIYVIGGALSLIFFGILAWQTLLDAIYATAINEMMMGSIYVVIWPSRWALPVGFAMVAFAVALHLWRAARDPDHFRAAPENPAAARGERR